MTRSLFVCLIALGLFACGAAPEQDASAEIEGQSAPEPASPTAGEGLGETMLLPNAKYPEPDLLTGGQPSTEQLDRIAEAGYKTVLSLRLPDEEGQLPESEYTSRGLVFRSMPIAVANDLDAANARAFSALLADRSLRPLVIHCGSGNRIGALFALEAFHIGGKPAEQALQIGRDTGLTRLEPVVRERLGLPSGEGEATATP